MSCRAKRPYRRFRLGATPPARRAA